MQIKWPAVLNYADTAELVYLSNESDWQREAEFQKNHYKDGDRIIDSSGNVFHLATAENGPVALISTHKSLSLHDFLGMIKAHASEQGACCVAKLYAPSFDDAFKMLDALDQN